MRRNVIGSLVGSLIMLGAGLYFLSIGLISTFNRIDLQAHGLTTSGVVLAAEGDDDGKLPKISFKTNTGQTVQFVSPISGSYTATEQVAVIYRPDDPQHASINNFGALWVTSIFQFIFALFLLGGSFLPIRAFLKQRWWFRRQRILAQISQIKTIHEDGTTIYQVISRWLEPTTGRIFSFASGELDFDPHQTHLTEVVVDIDPRNPEHYAVDDKWLKQARSSVLNPV